MRTNVVLFRRRRERDNVLDVPVGKALKGRLADVALLA